MWEEVGKHLLYAGSNVYFDTAYVSFYRCRGEMTDLIREIGTERVLFGSDYPWEDPGRAAGIMRDLDLSQAELEGLLWRNAARLLQG